MHDLYKRITICFTCVRTKVQCRVHYPSPFLPETKRMNIKIMLFGKSHYIISVKQCIAMIKSKFKIAIVNATGSWSVQ